MGVPVWTLSVDLQTKTATFQTGMAEAAKSARASFGQIKQAAEESAAGVASGTGNTRVMLGLLDNTIRGNHAMAMADLVHQFSQSSIVMGALPIAATAAGVALLAGIIVELAQKVREAREEQEKLNNVETQFHTTLTGAFNALDTRILQAGIHVDELNNDHLAALHKQLQLIDMQSMDDLIKSFDTVSKAAEEVFKNLQVGWYQMGIGSAGAKHAMEQFKVSYDSLLAQGKSKEAGDLLAGTLGSAKHILSMMEQVRANVTDASTGKQGDYNKFMEGYNELKRAGVGYTDKELASQQALVDTLSAQLGIQGKVAQLKQLQGSGAKASTAKTMGAEEDAHWRAVEQSQRREEQQEEQMWAERRARAIAQIQETEREKINATQEGSAARLAAMDAAIKEEEQKGLGETAFYRQLLEARVSLVRQMAEEQARLQQQAGQEEARHSLRMAALALAAEKQQSQLILSARRATRALITQEELREEDEDHRAKMAAFAKEIEALDKHGKDYENKLQAIHNREEEQERAHEDRITAIKEKAVMERNQAILSAESQFEDSIARGTASVITRHQTMAQMLGSIGDQMVQGMIQNAIKSMLAMDMTKEKEAASAARKAFLWGWAHGGPAAPFLAPTLAALAFTSVMAYAGGTDKVPGSGRGDTVPAMLTPGEGVVPGGVMDGLRKMAARGSFDGGPHYHVNAHFAPIVSAVDAEGVDKVLTKHADIFQRHLEDGLRAMNRG